MLISIALLFIIVWAVAFIGFHVAGFIIHILLVLGIISLIAHLVRKPTV